MYKHVLHLKHTFCILMSKIHKYAVSVWYYVSMLLQKLEVPTISFYLKVDDILTWQEIRVYFHYVMLNKFRLKILVWLYVLAILSLEFGTHVLIPLHIHADKLQSYLKSYNISWHSLPSVVWLCITRVHCQGMNLSPVGDVDLFPACVSDKYRYRYKATHANERKLFGSLTNLK